MSPTYAPVDPQLRTQTQSHSTITRRKFSDVPENFTARFVMTNTQAVIFEKFYRIDLKNGTEWFMLPIVNPQKAPSSLVKFVGAYNRTRLNAPGATKGIWEYSADMRHYLRHGVL